MCCKYDVHLSYGNTATRCISKADSKRCLLLHVPVAPPSSRAQEKTTTLGGTEPSSFITMLLSRTSCVAGNRRFWNIHRTHPIWVHAITISSTKRKNHCEDPVQHKRWTYPCYRPWIWNINRDGRAVDVPRLPNISQNVISKRGLYWRYLNVVPLWIKPSQKYRTVAITFEPTLVDISSYDDMNLLKLWIK